MNLSLGSAIFQIEFKSSLDCFSNLGDGDILQNSFFRMEEKIFIDKEIGFRRRNFSCKERDSLSLYQKKKVKNFEATQHLEALFFQFI